MQVVFGPGVDRPEQVNEAPAAGELSDRLLEGGEDAAAPSDQMAAALLGELRKNFLLLPFELVELDFDEFVIFQRLVKRGERCRGSGPVSRGWLHLGHRLRLAWPTNPTRLTSASWINARQCAQ